MSKEKELVTLETLEAQIYNVERVVVIIRRPADTMHEPYPYIRASIGNQSVRAFINSRLKGRGLKESEVVIVPGPELGTNRGLLSSYRYSMNTLRRSYATEESAVEVS